MLYLILILSICFANIVTASLYVGFSFPDQYPNVARVNQPYSFQIANITYRSTGGSVLYNATNLPNWLSFDPSSRTFTGQPTETDVSDSIDITLTGLDSADGSFISNNYSIICSSDPGLLLSSNDVMFTEISQYGQTNGENGLVVKPGDNLNIKFDPSTFKLNSNSSLPIVAYYGRLIDRSSLPNWLTFDSNSLTFYGTVPQATSDVAPSINYGFSFIATDYAGYAAAVGDFYLLVGAHQLSTSLNETIKVNGTLNSSFDIQVPVFSSIYQDGQPISAENISAVYSNTNPSYVTLNQGNYLLTGQFPDSSTFDNFTIVVQDKYGNQVDIPYLFDALSSAFTVDNLPNVNATKGEWFSYQLLDSLFTEGNATNVSVSYQSSNNWLSYSKSNQTLQGLAPKDLDSVLISVDAINEYENDTKSFNVVGINANVTATTTSSSSTSSSPKSTSTSSSESSNASSSSSSSKSSTSMSNQKKLAIGLGVGIPCFVLLCAALLLCCCLRRRKNNKTQDKQYDKHIVPVKNLDYEKGTKQSDHEPEIDGPGFGTTHHNPVSDDEDAHQLAALNVLKLDEKNKKSDSDARSTSSSLTLGEASEQSSNYYDASEKPLKSWRANDEGDEIIGASAAATAAIRANEVALAASNNRKSVASMSTVNTENLFSVRLVEDANTNRYSNQSSAMFGAGGQYYSTNSLNNILNRDDSGNIQRLDSDGNIVDYNVLPTKHGITPSSSSSSNQINRPRLSRSTSSNLDILMEENTSHEKSSMYHSAHVDSDPNTTRDSNHTYTDAQTENSYNLLSRFNNSANSSAANSDQQLHNKLYSGEENSSFVDEFKAIHNSNGEIQWSETNEDFGNTNALPSTIYHNNNHSLEDDIISMEPSSLNETFAPSEHNTANYRLSSSSLNKKAKLVEFTRKGSLREAAKLTPQQDHYELGETAHIHDDDSE